jgi:hypothetical protein
MMEVPAVVAQAKLDKPVVAVVLVKVEMEHRAVLTALL